MFSGDNPNKSVRKQVFIYKMKKRRNKGFKGPRPCVRINRDLSGMGLFHRKIEERFFEYSLGYIVQRFQQGIIFDGIERDIAKI